MAASEAVPALADIGLCAFTTTRQVGTFGVNGVEPVREVMGRWAALRRELDPLANRLATGTQVHGNHVVVHRGGWEGWLRVSEADGHLSSERGTAMAVTVADCVPVFIAHPGGACAVLHSGWRGTAARIVEQAIDAFVQQGFAAPELRLHTGPAICGRCYEVSADVYARLTGRDPGRPTPIDLRALIADHARALGVCQITASERCTHCDNERFFSHRAGDMGRQIAVIVASAAG